MKRKLLLFACAVLLGALSSVKADVSLSPFANAAGEWGGTGGVTKGDVYLVERYWGDSRPTGLIMAQAVSSVPNGTYDVVVIAHACHANGVGGSFVASNNTLSVNGASQTVATIDNSAVDNLPMTEYTFSNVSVTDGTMSIKLSADEAGANWFTIRAVSVTLKGSYTDYTNLLTNEEFTSNVDGWNAIQFVYHASGDGFNGGFAEMWRGDANTMPAGSIHQTVELPAGTYMLSANMRARRMTGYLYASIDDKEQKHAYIGNDNVGVRALTFVVKETSDVTIGFKHNGNATTGQGDKWIAIDDIKITRLGDVGEISLTSQIANPSFESDFTGWTNTGSMAIQGNDAFEKTGTKYAEFWQPNGTKSVSQTLSGLPSGSYRLTTHAKARGVTSAKVYVGGSETAVTIADSETDYNVPFINTGNDVTVGFESVGTGAGSSWICVDNFRLQYYGPCIASEAIALPDGGAMTAGQWYYLEIAVAGDNYNATATNLGNIVYTTDGNILIADQGSVSSKFTETENSLVAARYYVMSSSDNQLEVSVASYTYIVGDPTISIADGSYVKSLTSVTYTFEDEACNDPDATFDILDGSATASLQKNGVEVKTGALSLSGNVLTATFSDVTLVYNANDYSIVLPAGVVGFDGHESNTEVSISFNTPLFADGDYYMKNKDNGAYFAGGNGWGTQAITNSIGHKVTLTSLSDGKYYINTYLSNGGSNQYLNGLWCDGAATGWTFTASGDDYVISDNTGKLTAGSIGASMTLTDGTGDNTKWTLLTPAAWKAENVARLDAAAADNGVDATFYLPAANFNRNDLDNNSWQGEPDIDGLGGGDPTCNYNAQKWNVTPFDVYQALTGLSNGVYKLTAQGFYRNGTTDDRNALLYANGYNVALVNIRSAGVTSQDDDKGFTTANGDYYVPNKQDQAAKTFNNDYYNNELYFKVGDGTLRIGVKKDAGAAGDWTVFDNFKLTYYGAGAYVKVSSAGWATLYTDVALDFSGTGLTAYTATCDGSTVTLTEVDDVPAGTGVVLKGEANEYFIPTATSSSNDQGSLIGSATDATACPASAGFTYYILTKDGAGDAQFNPAVEGSIAAGKAYLKLGSAAKSLKVVFAGTATNVDAPVVVETEEEVLFNMAGIQVDKNFKGFVVNQKGEKRFNK